MDFKKCNRCGSFYLSEGDVCPKCNTKDTFELSTFKKYIEKNGTNDSINKISQELGIQVRHLNRFLGYKELQKYAPALKSNVPTNQLKTNQKQNTKKIEL